MNPLTLAGLPLPPTLKEKIAMMGVSLENSLRLQNALHDGIIASINPAAPMIHTPESGHEKVERLQKEVERLSSALQLILTKAEDMRIEPTTITEVARKALGL